jgi:hypothetical protein
VPPSQADWSGSAENAAQGRYPLVVIDGNAATRAPRTDPIAWIGNFKEKARYMC